MDELAVSLIKSGIFAEENRDEAVKIGAKFLGHSEEVLSKAKDEGSNKKPYYNNSPMIKKFGKWHVIERGGEMLFTGSEDDIIWKFHDCVVG